MLNLKENVLITKGKGYTVEMKGEVEHTVELKWHKRGRRPAILKELSIAHVDINSGELKKFRCRNDAVAVMKLIEGYMKKYEKTKHRNKRQYKSIK